MSQPGRILHYSAYEFEDGYSKNKFFVVLNVADINRPCLLLKTTSQSKRYEGAKKGCNPQKKVFFVPVDWGKCFELDTYIQLPQIFEISTEELLKGSFSNRIKVVGSLSTDCLAQLKNCLKHFTKDISQQHWDLIFKH